MYYDYAEFTKCETSETTQWNLVSKGLKATKKRHNNNNWKQKNKFLLRVEAMQWKGQDSNLTFMSEVLLSNGYHPSILGQ